MPKVNIPNSSRYSTVSKKNHNRQYQKTRRNHTSNNNILKQFKETVIILAGIGAIIGLISSSISILSGALTGAIIGFAILCYRNR